MDELFLGIDVGTTGVKVALVDAGGKVLRVEVLPHATRHPRPGWAEQDPNDWWSSIVAGVGRVLAAANADERRVKALGVSSMTPSLVGVDTDGDAFICHVWSDQRAVVETEEIRRELGDAGFLALCGNLPKPVYLAPKIVWLKRHMPDVYRHTRHFLNVAAYIGYRLTGVAAYSRPDCEVTLVHDKRTGTVDAGVCERFGIDPEKFPPTRRSDEILGCLAGKAAEELCLPAGLPVAVGGHDSPIAAYALGMTSPGDMFLDIGNAANLGRCVAKPVTCPSGDLYHHAVGDAWILQIYLASAGSAYRWFKEQFGGLETAWSELSDENPYELLNRQAAASPPGANGVLFMPYLDGCQANSQATGSFVGLRSSTSRRDMARAVLEGSAYALRRNLDEIEAAAGRSDRDILIGGGGSKSDLWNSMLADILERPLTVTAVRDAAAFGAAMLAAQSVGVTLPRPPPEKTYQPASANRDLYRRRSAEFAEIAEIILRRQPQ